MGIRHADVTGAACRSDAEPVHKRRRFIDVARHCPQHVPGIRGKPVEAGIVGQPQEVRLAAIRLQPADKLVMSPRRCGDEPGGRLCFAERQLRVVLRGVEVIGRPSRSSARRVRSSAPSLRAWIQRRRLRSSSSLRSSRRSSRRSLRRPTPWATTAVVATAVAVRATGVGPMTLPLRARLAARGITALLPVVLVLQLHPIVLAR